MKNPPFSAPSPSSKPLSSPPPSVRRPSHFTPIQEDHQEEDNYEGQRQSKKENSDLFVSRERRRNGRICNSASQKRAQAAESRENHDMLLKWNKCRPHAREKISVVPLDNNGEAKHSFSMASPTDIFKSVILSLRGKSPKSSCGSALTTTEEQWKITAEELSNKLIQATRKGDEAILEASRLNYSITDLEKKFKKLEIYCEKLKIGIEDCSGNGIKLNIIDNFLISVSEARSSVRLLSQSLIMSLRHNGSKVYERISVLLQPYDVKIPLSKNPKSLIFYLEALLNQVFYEEFESVGFHRNSTNSVLNPNDRCEKNFKLFAFLQGMTWEEVLSKGTKHFSEEFSRYCDRKMSEIVGMLGWNRAWPEPLLEAFFGASKSVWLVHLLANSVNPSLAIFRVDKATLFDRVYMDDIAPDQENQAVHSVPSMVRIMVAPGFYVFDNVIKCKVVCRYCSDHTVKINGSLT